MARKARFAIGGMARIVAITPELESFASYATLRADEWDRRHRAMIDHIVVTAATAAGKRIVVICGFEHRYALRGALAKASGLRLREY